MTALIASPADVAPHFEQTRAAWLATARAVTLQLGQGGAVVTVDDVRRFYPQPVGADGRVMGAVFNARG